VKKSALRKLLHRALVEIIEHDHEYQHVTPRTLIREIELALEKRDNPITEFIGLANAAREANAREKERAEHAAVWDAVGGMGVYTQEGKSLGVVVNIDHSLGVLKVDTSRHDRAPDRR